MSVKIKFNENAFKKEEELSTNFEKPEFKKFNMKFNNLDLIIIDAVAKRAGVSRSQIVNEFIEDILKSFILNCPEHEAFLMCKYAESLNKDSIKSDQDFSWEQWFADLRYGTHPAESLHHANYNLSEEMKSDNVSKELVHLLKVLKMSKATLDIT